MIVGLLGNTGTRGDNCGKRNFPAGDRGAKPGQKAIRAGDLHPERGCRSLERSGGLGKGNSAKIHC